MVTYWTIAYHTSCSFLGIICFCLINMQPVPYATELKHMNISKRDTLGFVKKKISKGCTPEVKIISIRENKKKTWYYILQAGKASLKIDPSERPSTKILKDILNSTLEYVSYPLCNHQGTALVQAQEINIGKTFVF